MPATVPAKPRAPKKTIAKPIETVTATAAAIPKKKATRAKREPRHISSGAGMTAGLELWTSATGQIELRDTTADNRFTSDVSAWSSLNAAALKKSKDAEK